MWSEECFGFPAFCFDYLVSQTQVALASAIFLSHRCILALVRLAPTVVVVVVEASAPAAPSLDLKHSRLSAHDCALLVHFLFPSSFVRLQLCTLAPRLSTELSRFFPYSIALLLAVGYPFGACSSTRITVTQKSV